MAVIGLHHIGISVPDLEAAERFYAEAFGFRRILFESWSSSEVADAVTGLDRSAARGVNLWAGNVVVELFEFSAPEPSSQDPDHRVSDHGLSHLCLEVDDIHAEVNRLGEMGMRWHTDPVGDASGWFTYGRDPWGNVIELVEINDSAVPNLGGWDFRTLPDRSYD